MKYIKLLFLIIFIIFLYDYIQTHLINTKTIIHWNQFKLGYILLSIIAIIPAFLISINVFKNSLLIFSYNEAKQKDLVALAFIPPLGKYIPGKILTYTGTIYYLNKIGLSMKQGLLFSFFLMAYNLVMALIISIFSLPFLSKFNPLFFIVILVAILFVTLIWFYKFKEFNLRKINYKHQYLLKLSICILIQYILAGISLFLIIFSMMEIPVVMVFKIIIMNTIASISGIMAFFSPGGIGVKEGVFYYLINDTIVNNEVLIISLMIQRSINIILDLLLALIAYKFYLSHKNSVNDQ